MTGESLRDILGAEPRPEFELHLPPGWTRQAPDEATKQQMRAKILSRMSEAHRPDLAGQALAMLDESFAAMSRTKSIAMFTPTEPGEATLWIPASMVATVRTANAEYSLDDVVRHAIATFDATPLHGDQRFVRFERERTETIDGVEVCLATIVYLTPIPGTRRREALQLFVTIVRPPDAPANDEPMEQMRVLFDACVSTLRWLPPKPE